MLFPDAKRDCKLPPPEVPDPASSDGRGLGHRYFDSDRMASEFHTLLGERRTRLGVAAQLSLPPFIATLQKLELEPKLLPAKQFELATSPRLPPSSTMMGVGHGLELTDGGMEEGALAEKAGLAARELEADAGADRMSDMK